MEARKYPDRFDLTDALNNVQKKRLEWQIEGNIMLSWWLSDGVKEAEVEMKR